MTKLYNVADRVANRIMRHLPRRQLSVAATTPIVSFTFDDVPDTAASKGAKILEAHGVRGTFYIAGGLAGRREPDRSLIEIDGCRELAAVGHEIGCHTFSHDVVRRMGRQRLRADLDTNARYLQQVAPGFTARNFAFPYNLASPRMRDELAQRYRSCRGGWEGINRGPTDPGYLKAVELRQPEELAEDRLRWIDNVVQDPGWLIFFTHDITETPTPYGCTPRTLDKLVSYALEKGCVVLPVDQTLDRPEVSDIRTAGAK